MVFREFLYGFLKEHSCTELFEVLIPENHEHEHKFYLDQLLFKSGNIYVKIFGLKELYLGVYFRI